jgi:two-component system sensor histidine kinase KdpD
MIRTLFATLHRSLTDRYLVAVFVAAAITGIIQLFDPMLETATIAMVFLLGVLIVATTAGLGPGALISLLSFLAFNFFFVAPRYTLHVESAQDVLHLGTFLAVAVASSTLAARARSAADRANRQATELSALYQLSQTISAQVDLGSILPVIAHTTCQLLDVSASAIWLYDDAGQLIEQTRVGDVSAERQMVRILIRDGANVLGFLEVVERSPGGGLREEERQLLATLAAQTRLAIDRSRLVAQVAHNQALSESDRLKSALLASVTHDLRTPLAILKGATSTLFAEGVVWDAATQRSLGQTIDMEIDHLNRIVGNLLDMSRIEAGTLPSERDWYDLAEVIGATLQHLDLRLNGRPLTVDLAPDLPFVFINPVLVDQILTNLLENALKYTPQGTPIALIAQYAGAADTLSTVTVTVRDHGPGIPEHDHIRIFEKFYRGRSTAGQAGGAGLGLSICKGIIEAHGGRIWAENRPDGGAAFSFTLPKTASAPILATAVPPHEREHGTALSGSAPWESQMS